MLSSEFLWTVVHAFDYQKNKKNFNVTDSSFAQTADKQIYKINLKFMLFVFFAL